MRRGIEKFPELTEAPTAGQRLNAYKV
jgi:hypothetical protein